MNDSLQEWTSKYTWLEPIAQGGMGQVFLAEEKGSGNTRCVIKQLRSIDRQSPEERSEAQRLFRREVDLLKELNHPGIVRFFDHYVSEDGKYFLVMDYITGNNLETIVQNFGPFSQDDAIKVGIQICEVLEYLHENDPPIIYRDLKPSNLMLTPDGQVIFIDFGIARVFMPAQSATRVVTAGYSPPEQYFGRPDTRSDLYALGATLSHLLTGVRPRPLITSVPSQHVDSILPQLDKLVKDLTQHSPDDRPSTAREVRHSLYRSYQKIHPDFEVPDFSTDIEREAQFISQKIMSSGLDKASSVSESLPAARGPEQEVYSDEEMPTGIKKMFANFVSGSKIPRLDTSDRTTEYDNGDDLHDSFEDETQAKTVELQRKSLRTTLDRHTLARQQEQSIWQKFLGLFKGKK